MLQRFLVGALVLLSLGLGINAYLQSDTLAATKTQLRTLEAELAQAKKPAPAPVTTVQPPARRPAPANFPQQPILDPAEAAERKRLMDLRTRSALDVQYSAMFRALALPPEKLEKLQRLLQDRRNVFNDVMSVMRAEGLAPIPENAAKIQALVDQSVAEIETQIQADLGTEDYARYKAYESTQIFRRVAFPVQQRLSYSSEPLTDQQYEQLTVSIARNNPSYGASPLTSSINSEAPRITAEVLDNARSFLSAAQLTALQQIKIEQDASLQLARLEAGP